MTTTEKIVELKKLKKQINATNPFKIADSLSVEQVEELLSFAALISRMGSESMLVLYLRSHLSSKVST